MGRLIEPLPGLSLLKPKVGSAVDDNGVGVQLGSYLSRSAIGQLLWSGLAYQPIRQRNQVWMMLAEEGSRTGARSQCSDLHLGMGKQQSEQFSPCITRGARHR